MLVAVRPAPGEVLLQRSPRPSRSGASLSRDNDPLKRWKLSPVDKLSRTKWDAYTEAKKAMLFHTDTSDAPWTVIKSDDKKRARLACLRHFLGQFDYPGKDEQVVIAPDPLLVGEPRQVLDTDEMPPL